MAKKFGVLPSQMIREIMEAGFVKGGNPANINPGSLDLSLSDEMYRVEGIFLPRPGEKVRELLEKVDHSPHTFEEALQKDVTYLVRLNEVFTLPADVYGYCNPKSSTGRNDVHVRILADGVSRYDMVPGGYQGELWLAVQPNSYPIQVTEEAMLVQLRLFNHDTRLSELELEVAMRKDNLLFDSHGEPISYDRLKIKDGDGSVILRLDIERDPIGYVCFGADETIDFSKLNFYEPDKFFKRIEREGDFIRLKKGGFYILSSKEAVRIPPHFACEMVPMDERSGEFRSHYAGFIDPGWGCGKEGEGKGRSLTLEVRPFEDMIVRERQVIAKIKFERMMDAPDTLYDASGKSNYSVQSGARLSKHFIS